MSKPHIEELMKMKKKDPASFKPNLISARKQSTSDGYMVKKPTSKSTGKMRPIGGPIKLT